MGSPFDDLTESVFAEKTVLAESYQPKTILERDEEIEAYSHALQDVLFGREPENVFVYGKAGLGKTAVTKYMMDELRAEVSTREEADDLRIHTTNCNGRTLFMVVRDLVNELLPDHASRFPKRGLGTGDAFDELYQQFDRLGGTHYVVFDEIDHLDEANTLLYELPRARANGHISNANVGVIGISNDYTFRQTLSPKVKDTLMETEISFSPYDAAELRTILEHRADRALVDGACNTSAIAKAAALAAQDMGNARQALDLLRVGAELAEQNGETPVTDNHIETARDRVQRGRLENKIRDQTEHAQYILEAIANLHTQGEIPARSKEIQRTYKRVADSHAASPLSTLKSIQDHLSDLHMLGFLRRHEQNKGLSGGQYYEYELDLDPEIVLDTRAEIAEHIG
ncbi:cell division control protein Cdc6 [Halobacteriales archaeon SW_6_65_46]|nr:MAG: cell division control protein Cdc6 [Halobacteriales archaeon SW_6_65_46]